MEQKENNTSVIVPVSIAVVSFLGHPLVVSLTRPNETN